MKTLIKPLELRKRFVIAVAIVFTAFFLFSLAACGSDTPTSTNNPPTPETPILSFDTMLVYAPNGLIDSLHSAMLTKTVRIDFNAETNTSSGSSTFVLFKYKQWQDIGTSINGAHSFTVSRDSSQSTAVLFQLLASGNTSQYLKVFNAKVYKVN